MPPTIPHHAKMGRLPKFETDPGQSIDAYDWCATATDASARSASTPESIQFSITRAEDEEIKQNLATFSRLSSTAPRRMAVLPPVSTAW